MYLEIDEGTLITFNKMRVEKKDKEYILTINDDYSIRYKRKKECMALYKEIKIAVMKDTKIKDIKQRGELIYE